MAVAMIALALWVKSRWHAWFVSLPETEYSIAVRPDRVTLLPGSDFDSERIVTWRVGTDLSHSYALLACNGDTTKIEAEGAIVNNTGGKDAFYRVVFSDLSDGADYSYQLVTENHNPSPWYSFSMPNHNGIKKLIYIGDVQDTVGGDTKKLLKEIVAMNNDADLIVFGGDLIEGPVDKFWNYTYDCLDSISQEFPIVSIAGNHEYRKSLVPYLDHRWKYSFGYDDNGAIGVDASYYIDSDNVLLVAMDTQCLMRGYTALNQYLWMRDVVAERGEGKYKILVMHHPPYSVKPKRNNVLEKRIFAPLAEELGFDVVLAGHEHGYGRFIKKNDEEPLYIVSHCSPKIYPAVEGDSNKKVIYGKRMYQILEFDGDSISNFKLRYNAYDAYNHELLDRYISAD